MRPAEHFLPDAPHLTTWAASQALALFIDFDGTLIEIAGRPDAIAVPPSLRSELEQAAALLRGRLAVVSGRPVSELRHRLGPVKLALAGSHGAEIVDATGRMLSAPGSALPAEAASAIRQFAAGTPSVLLEEKPLGLALHYRQDPALEPSVLSFAKDLTQTRAVALKRGKCVAEFVVPGAHKGLAVDKLMASEPFAGAAPVFIGDDETDEDGFAAAVALGGWGIAVGERPSRNAVFRLASPDAVREWIRRGS